MSDLIHDKNEARQMAKARRKAAKAENAGAASDACAVFFSEIEIRAGDIVSAYRPIFSELDPSPILERLHRRGVTLGVPVIEGESRPLHFARWTPKMLMVEGAFGAEIPETVEYVTPTVLLVPLLTFDRRGYRLGYGGGFYDRTLEKLRAAGPVQAVGFAYAAQEVDMVPIEPTDQRLDAVITELGLIQTSD